MNGAVNGVGLQNFVEGRARAQDLRLLVDLGSQVADDGIDFASQRCESADYGERHQRRGNGILGELKTSFVFQESFNHWMLLIAKGRARPT
jgi:hypothetical protein